MKRFFDELSIKQTFVLLFSIFGIALIGSYIAISTFITIHEADQVAINLATKHRLQTQLLYLYAEKSASGDKDVISRMNKYLSSSDRSLPHLRKGGVIADLTSDMDLRPAEGELLEAVQHAEKVWQTYKAQIDVVLSESAVITTTLDKEQATGLIDENGNEITETVSSTVAVTNPKVKEALDYLKTQEEAIFKANDAVVKKSIARFDNSSSLLTTLIWVAAFINLIVLAIGYLLISKRLLNPLNTIKKTAEQIKDGDLSTGVAYNRDDEVGKVAAAINNLIDNLKNATDFIQHIGKGELNAQYKGVDTRTNVAENTLVGSLLQMRDQMITVAEAEKQRKWSTEGLAHFVGILRSNIDDNAAFTHNIISNIIEYLKANQGALFLVNDDNENDIHLELTACYAYSKRKYLHKRIEIGEGLVGQAYLEQDIIYMTEIPQDYVSIKSGLGGANPASLLIVPLKVNDKIHGIIEIASFNTFQPYEIEFIEKLGENIASTLSSVKINSKTRKLLEESQGLTEQMRAQEEEMRQNMEELEATQEEMRRTQQAIIDRETKINS
jgi:methyl-accepting chemotaxis protein